MNKYYNSTWASIVEGFQSNIDRGLTEEECKVRRKEFGNNKISLPSSKGIFIEIIKMLKEIYILIQIAIVCFLIINSEFYMSVVTGIILIINIAIKSYYIYKKDEQINYIQKLNYSTVTVLRDGRIKLVTAEELVVGDIVHFKKNSLIAADIRIVSSDGLRVDEKNLTGEEFLKEKYENRIEGNAESIGEIKNMLFKGTVIKGGEGTGIVVETGNNTQLGRLLSMLKYASNNKHTLEKKIENNISKVQAILGIIALGLYFFMGNGEKSILINSIFILGIIPITAIILIYIYIIYKNLYENGIELINISTVDMIQDIDVLFIDKIGAITKEEMIVDKLLTNFKIIDKNEVDYNGDSNIKRALDVLLLCNNAIYNAEDDTGKGELSEIAFLRFGAKNRVYKSILDSQNKRKFEIPIDSAKRFLTTITKSKKGYRANIKGNLDQVLDKCTHIMLDGVEKEITDEDIEKIRAFDYNFSGEGLITVGIAYRSFSYEPSISENIESNLVFVGIVALENPLNENVKEKIIRIKERGIVPILFTEDNKITATTIGKKAKIVHSDNEVISGIELDSLNREETIGILSKARVFSRVNPEIKGKIVAMFAKDNYNVAATGEGLGDLPTLNISKIGIGKGAAPKLVKKVSDIFIKENYLDKVFDLYKRGAKIKASIFNIFNVYATILISQILTIDILKIAYNLDVNSNTLTYINLFVCIILLFNLTLEDNKLDLSDIIFRILIWSTSTILLVGNLNNEILVFPIFIGMILIYILGSSNIIKSKNISLIIRYMIIASTWVGITFILTFSNKIMLTSIEFLEIGLTFVIYFIFELLYKRWQKSN